MQAPAAAHLHAVVFQMESLARSFFGEIKIRVHILHVIVFFQRIA